MADLPELPAEARRRIGTAAEKARIRIRAEQKRFLRENAFHPHKQELDPERSARMSVNYALAVFQPTAAEYWNLRTDYEAFRGWLARLIEEIRGDVERKWQGLNVEDQMTFEAVCLPKIKDALRGERDKWLLRRLIKRRQKPRS